MLFSITFAARCQITWSKLENIKISHRQSFIFHLVNFTMRYLQTIKTERRRKKVMELCILLNVAMQLTLIHTHTHTRHWNIYPHICIRHTHPLAYTNYYSFCNLPMKYQSNMETLHARLDSEFVKVKCSFRNYKFIKPVKAPILLNVVLTIKNTLIWFSKERQFLFYKGWFFSQGHISNNKHFHINSSSLTSAIE